MLLKSIILHCQQQMQYERSIFATFHLLKGKQSIQTIQDAHLFSLERFFSILKTMTKNEYTEIIKQLQKENYLQNTNEENLIITDKAIIHLNNNPFQNVYWNGMKYNNIDQLFYERLLLIIQVWTNVRLKNNRFIAIVENEETQQWIKRYYVQHKHQVTSLIKQLYDELLNILSLLPTIYPQLFLHLITTENSIGLTNRQIALKFNIYKHDLQLMIKNMIHFMMKKINEHSETFPLLFSLTEGLNEENNITSLTNSAQQTAIYLKKGYPIEEIARRRNLKLNTIYDHIVEIALQNHSFQIDNYITKEERKEIYLAVRKLRSFKLKEIKQIVSDHITYFQIRLALSRLKH